MQNLKGLIDPFWSCIPFQLGIFRREIALLGKIVLMQILICSSLSFITQHETIILVNFSIRFWKKKTSQFSVGNGSFLQDPHTRNKPLKKIPLKFTKGYILHTQYNTQYTIWQMASTHVSTLEGGGMKNSNLLN